MGACTTKNDISRHSRQTQQHQSKDHDTSVTGYGVFPHKLANEKTLPTTTSGHDADIQNLIMQEINNQPAYGEQNSPLGFRKLTWSDFKIISRIGKGSFGQVFLGQLKHGPSAGKRYAIKRMKKSHMHKKQLLESIKLQKKILKESTSPFVVHLRSAFRDDDFYYIVMEMAEGGDTYSLVKPGTERAALFRKTGEEGVRFVLACLLLSLQYLHSRRVVYRDLKPQNLLIFDDGYVKLTDFGLSKQLKPGQRIVSKCGTPLYFAPETVLGVQAGRQIDLWGLGIIAYELATGTLPFQGYEVLAPEAFVDRIVQMQKDRAWPSQAVLSPNLKDFIGRLLRYDPKKRLGARNWRQIKNHRFFSGFPWNELINKQMTSPLRNLVTQSQLEYEPYNAEHPIASRHQARERSISGWSSICEPAM